MFNIVYRSLASPTTKQPDVEDILKRARRFNIDNEITGCLVYHKGLFIQYLEGNKNIVLELYSRIEKDVRHTDVTLLSSGYIYSREFDNWSMGYQNIIIANNQFKYLEFMVNPLIDIPDMLVVPNPTSKRFWVAAKKLINGNDP
ncbi:MAG: hypothetical protein ACJAUQ_002062 [Maribacter sp.]|jgi:hypothetical protein